MEVVVGQNLPLAKFGVVDQIARELVAIAFGQRRFLGRAGLYFAGIEGGVLRIAERVTYVSWIDDAPEGSFVTGAAFVLHGLQFALSFQPEGLPSEGRVEARQGHGVDFGVRRTGQLL